jgi:hypothetical protein
MAYPTTPQDWINRLARAHDYEKPFLRTLNDEYELRSPKMYMHPEIMRELGDRLQQVVIAWPMLVVDSLEERLDVEGFRLPDEDGADDDLWRVWQENNADEESQLAHVDALTMKRSYIAVGTNEDDDATPLVTFESPLEVYAESDPRTKRVLAALRRYCDTDHLVRANGQYDMAGPATNQYATLYLPDSTIHYEMGQRGWQEVDRDEHGLGVVPVVPIVNRSRLADRTGRSELSPILPLSHAANKIATDLMVAAEFVAIPLRGFLGLGPDALEDENGNKMTAMQAILGRLLMIPEGGEAGSTVKQFEFASAQLSNFHSTIDKLASLVASLSGMPPHYLGMTTDNPASADAIRSNEARLVKRAERRQRAFGGSHEQAMRLVRRFQEGDWDPRLKRLETIWRDASTPTVAQSADAAVKLYNLPQPILPLRMARQRIGMTQGEIKLAEDEDAKQQQSDLAMFKMETAAQATSAATPADTGANLTGGPDDAGNPADTTAPALAAA